MTFEEAQSTILLLSEELNNRRVTLGDLAHVHQQFVNQQTVLNAAHVQIQEAAHHLLDAMKEAEYAQGLDDKQDARWAVTACAETLKAALEKVD